MLKRSLLTAGLAAGMFMPASAELAIDSFTAIAKGQDVTYNLSAHNPGDVSQQGPIILKIMARPNGDAGWEEVKTWNIENLAAGAGLSQSFTASGAAAAARKGDWEARVWVQIPNHDKWDEGARVIIEK